MWEKYKQIIPYISVDPGVIDSVAKWVLSCDHKTVLAVCDPNTRKVAGKRVIDSIRNIGLNVIECCFIEDEPVPDEYAIGFLTAAYNSDIDLILGIGSGTINDLCTYVGAKVGCPSAIVGTAPSMDGYASLGSAMILGGLKVTPPTQCPVAIFCDTEILAAAPMLLTAAGLGDMLGKITALADWRLAHLLVGEEMPPDIVDIVETALKKIIKGAPDLSKRDPAVIKNVTEGLILSGIAMSLYGDSRPASGTEHHLAHFWEMRMLAEGRKPALHGIKVGLATIIGLLMWSELKKTGCICKKTCQSDYEDNIRRLYGHSADTVLQTENPDLSIDLLQKNWQAITDIAVSLPSPDEIEEMLAAASAPVRPSEIGLSEDMLRDSIIYARDRKKIYTLLQLLGDLGSLDDFADRVTTYFSGRALAGVKCFVLDMDGTIYLGDRLFPYTKKFLDFITGADIDHIFYTNNSSQNSMHYLKKLKKMGIPVNQDKFLMSTQVLLDHVSFKHGKRVFIAGTKALKDDFEAAGYILSDTGPDFAVLGFDTDMDYERLISLCDFVRSGLPYYGVNMDYNCPVEGGFIPDCGALAAAVFTSTGITPEFFGKPSRYTLDHIIKKTGYSENELCFIGDRLYTDIAVSSGTKARSVLVLSGETKPNDLQGSAFVPDLVVNDLEELMKYIRLFTI